MASVRVDYCERQPAFGHFETVRLTGTRILRWLAYLALTGVLGATVGHDCGGHRYSHLRRLNTM